MKEGAPIRRVIVEGLARLPAFCHATMGRADLVLGAAVEIDCIARKP